MVTAIFNYQNSHIMSYEVLGHADSAQRGEDLVCAAISATVIGLTNAVIELDESELFIQMEEDGYIKVENVPPTDKAQTLLQGMITTLKTIEGAHKDNYKYLTIIEDK